LLGDIAGLRRQLLLGCIDILLEYLNTLMGLIFNAFLILHYDRIFIIAIDSKIRTYSTQLLSLIEQCLFYAEIISK